jgi:class 3 adenylate cyclase/tetratricopeptide (TPR) repeat protein
MDVSDCAAMDRLAAYVPDLALGWDADTDHPWSRREATMMFADLSGFTRLSERVARVKGAGAEVVKRTINAVFEPCIDAVLREHGDVVKFAGDGLMMMFTGEGHPLTAARAAVALQAAVRRIGSVSTPAGPARIGVSIGISTGEYLCLLSRVGRLEPVVVGPALDAMFAAEAFARSGQTVVDDALAAVLPAEILRPVRGSTYRQLRADAPLLAATGGEPVRGHAVRAASEFLEPRVRIAIEDGDTPPEHRSAAIAFLALDGLAEVRAREGDAGLHAHVERFLGSVARACAATDVCWLESDADRDQVRVLLTAGAPYRTDIDEQRMIDAVWRIRIECEGLLVRAGISRGRVFVADVGHPLRRTYNVMGDAVNVAARLAGKAAHGEVLALQTVAGARRSMARVEARAPLSVKGKKAPLVVCSIVGLTVADDPQAAQAASTTMPTLGRSAELRQLSRHVAALRRRRGGAVMVVGEAGMGKSHLVDTALAEWPGAVVGTRGHEFERSTLFGAAARLLREAVGIDVSASPEAAGEQLERVVAQSAPDLVERLPLMADVARAVVPSTRAVDAVRPEFRLEQTVVATVALLRAVRPAATVFVADDVDRFDHSSIALLAAVRAAAGELPWLVITTSRSEPAVDGADAGGDAGAVVRLGPLTSADVRRLVLQIAGDVGLTKRVIDDIVRHSDGNPMIAHELTLGWATGAREVELPDAVERAVASRIDNLPTAARVLIRELSVAGVGVEWSLARAVLGPSADEDATWAALREYVTRSAGAVQFERELYAVAAYQGLAHERRQALHRALAVELAGRPYARFEAARIAEHAHAGGDQALAWQWSRAAADVAASVGAADDAAEHLAHAVQAVDHGAAVSDDELLAVLEALGDAHERVGHPLEAHEAFKRARGLVAEGSPAHLRLYRKHARVAERAGAWTQSLRWVTRALAEVPADAGADLLAEQAELELTAAVVRFFQGKLKPAVELARGAAATAERAGSRRGAAQAELQLEMCCSELGLPERAAHGLRALELFELLDDHLGLANLRLNLGVSCYNEARWDQALHHYGRSIVEYALVGDLVGAAATTNNRAEILTDQGRDAEALDALEEARRGLKAANYRIGVAITSSGLGRLATRRGDFAAAAAWLAEARDEFVALDAAQLVADTDVRLIELDVWRGDVKAALRAMPRVRAFVDETGPSPVLAAGLARLEAWGTLGPGAPRDARARTRARRVWNDAIATARREGFPYEVALAADGYVVSVGDDALARERDDLFHRMGVVSPPRPPWLTTV